MKRWMVLLLNIAAASCALAHDGRRFEVKVIDGKIVAHGYVSNGVDDGGGVIRPYYNALHGHWENNPSPAITAASADLPGFDILDEADELIGHDLTYQLLGGKKWTSPVEGGPVVLEDLAPSEIFVTYGFDTLSTASGGSLTLLSIFNGSNGDDLDLSYDIADKPIGVVHLLELRLSTDAPGIEASDTIYTILTPQGQFHHVALYLEGVLGTPIPEPTVLGLILTGITLYRRRARRRAAPVAN